MGVQSSRIPHPKHTIPWHRTKLSPEVTTRVHATSDVQGELLWWCQFFTDDIGIRAPSHHLLTCTPPFRSSPWHSMPQGAIQSVGILAMLASWVVLALYFNDKGNTPMCLMAVLMYGLQANFLINGMHELGHGQVFKTKALNTVFLRIISFLGWLHPDMFFSSHLRHHRQAFLAFLVIWFLSRMSILDHARHCALLEGSIRVV